MSADMMIPDEDERTTNMSGDYVSVYVNESQDVHRLGFEESCIRAIMTEHADQPQLGAGASDERRGAGASDADFAMPYEDYCRWRKWVGCYEGLMLAMSESGWVGLEAIAADMLEWSDPERSIGNLLDDFHGILPPGSYVPEETARAGIVALLGDYAGDFDVDALLGDMFLVREGMAYDATRNMGPGEVAYILEMRDRVISRTCGSRDIGRSATHAGR